MKKIFLLLVFLISTNLFSQTGWVEINTGFQRIITDVYFVNPNTGWAVGDSIIIKSTNGGVNWFRQDYNYLNIRTSLNSVRFINENTGFTAGGHYSGFYDFYFQYIFKTTNGGANWNVLYHVQGSANSVISRIFPVNQNVIYAAHLGSAFDAASGGVMKSSNGGINFPSYFSKGEGNSLYCVDSNTAWVSFFYWTDVPAWKGYIYKTTNGGINWVEQFRDSLYNSSRINSICFVNQNTGFALGQIFNSSKSKFFKTTNSGVNWDTVRYTNGRSKSVYFVNSSTGWIGGHWMPDTSCISYTTNGGANWTLQKKGGMYVVNNLFFVNSLSGWATLSSSSILRTTTGGITFVNNISNEIPEKFLLYQNYPNPFNPNTSIKYQITRHSGSSTNNNFVSIKIFDVLGRKISTLVNEKQSHGTYEVLFDGSKLPSGIYFYKLETNSFFDTKRMILLK